MKYNFEEKCLTCNNRHFVSTGPNSIPGYGVCPDCLTRVKSKCQYIYPKKELIYKNDIGNIKMYSSFYLNTDPLTTSFPFVSERWIIKAFYKNYNEGKIIINKTVYSFNEAINLITKLNSKEFNLKAGIGDKHGWVRIV